MVPPRSAMRLVLWVAGSCLLLAVWASAQDEGASQQLTQRPGSPGDRLCSGAEPSDPSCPRRRKAATLEPSFTKTTPPPTTHRMKTTHQPTTHPANHTTSRAANHTTPHTTHHHTSVHTTPHHPTTHTMPHHPTTHTTPHHPSNHTTPHHPTTHTTPHHPTTHTTPHHPTTHTTPHHPSNHTTAPINHTTPHHPTNHTTPIVITTPPWPTDKPLVAVGNYTVQAQNGSTTCLWLEAGLEIQVQFTSKAKQRTWGTFAVQPNRTKASGACSGNIATLKLSFPEGFLVFNFKKNETRGKSYLSRVQANLTYQFREATETSFGADNSSLQEFEVSVGHSYKCQNRTLALNGDVHLHVLNEQVQAFDLPGGKFGEAEVCKEQRRSLLVPIIVIVVLAVLVIIVLVAYAVGRKRSHRGYETL